MQDVVCIDEYGFNLHLSRFIDRSKIGWTVYVNLPTFMEQNKKLIVAFINNKIVCIIKVLIQLRIRIFSMILLDDCMNY